MHSRSHATVRRLPLGGLLLLAACGESAAPAVWHEESGYRWQELNRPGRRADGFTAQPASLTGIEFTNRVSDSAALRNRHLMQGSGTAIGDVNGDGRLDVYFCRIEGPNALYLNEGNWRFREAAQEAGIALGDRASTGAVFADLDGDGDLDLIVTAMGGRNALFLNDGSGRFRDATAASGFVAEGRGSTTATLADIDGNGSLDLYIANYKTRTMLDSLSPEERSFERITRPRGTGYEVIPERRDDYKIVYRNDLRRVSLVQRADPDWFYLNDGGGRFTREPLARNPRFLDEAGRTLAEEPEDFGLAARFYDVNADGAPDLYVANDFEDPDQFWINDGAGRFRLIAAEAVRRISNSNMAVDFGDVDRDGHVDLFQVDMLANDSRRAKTERPTHRIVPKPVGYDSSRGQWQRNALLLGRGDGTFAEIADAAGVAASGWSWSVLFLDVDLDGYEDLLIGNGHTWDLMDADTQERLRSEVTGVPWREVRKLYPPLALENVAFRNRGNRTFEDASARWRFGTEADISHGMAAGDLDGDGDLDVVLNRLGSPAAILRNDASAPRVTVRLRGAAPNTGAIGAKVRVTAPPLPPQEREVTAGGLYLSGSAGELAFATGSAEPVAIEVRWRDGKRTRISDAHPGRRYEIQEGQGPLATPDSRLPIPARLFEDASERLQETHSQTRFNDFARQPLLWYQLSQLGPGVSWIDLDGDTRDDLVVPAGAGGVMAWHRNSGTGFNRTQLGLRSGALDFTAAVGLPASSGMDLLLGRSSYRAASRAEALAISRVLRISARGSGEAEELLGADSASVGPLALADVDGDGSLDLFVGARVVPGMYPVPPSSRLYLNRSGRFTLDQSNAAALQQAGMVSGAVFSDLNGDGWPDLVLATEWGPLKLLLNDRGRLRDATREWGLDRHLGAWNGVTAADLDEDGRMDLVGTGWGRNLPLAADSSNPLYLYVGNFGAVPAVDFLLARHDPRLDAIAPLGSFVLLSETMPSLRARVPSFAAYADASIEQVIGPAFRRTVRLELTTTAHTVFLNRGGRFEPRPLPDEAQWAPAFGVAAADFDGDGHEDLFLAQNFSPTELDAPRLDAGRGMLLLGDGKGGLSPVPGQRSGIVIYGDQRGAAVSDYDGDGRSDLAVAQNAGPVRLFRNTGARPGLSVSLTGPSANPRGVGALVRLRYAQGFGPGREIHAGSGYWSSDGLVPVLGLREGMTVQSVWVRWPGGRTTETPVPAGANSVRVAP